MTDTPEQACGAGACPGVYPVRCGLGSCPDVFPQDNGDILVIGRIATAEEVSASGGNVGEGEVALVIAESFFDKLPVVAELRARIAKLEGEESFPEVQSFSPEALEKMREYARNADELNAQRVVDLGCQADITAAGTAVSASPLHPGAGGEAYWTYDAEEGAWYFGLKSRAEPPYLTQKHFDAIVDLDSEGRLVGIELLEALEPSKAAGSQRQFEEAQRADERLQQG